VASRRRGRPRNRSASARSLTEGGGAHVNGRPDTRGRSWRASAASLALGLSPAVRTRRRVQPRPAPDRRLHRGRARARSQPQERPAAGPSGNALPRAIITTLLPRGRRGGARHRRRRRLRRHRAGSRKRRPRRAGNARGPARGGGRGVSERQRDTGYIERGNAVIVSPPRRANTTRATCAPPRRCFPKPSPKAIRERAERRRRTAEPVANVAASLERAYAALAIGRRIFGRGASRVRGSRSLSAVVLGRRTRRVARVFAARPGSAARLRRETSDRARTHARALLRGGAERQDGAAQLHVHRHTVFYRLRQIGEICSCSLESSGDQLTLRLAIAIHCTPRLTIPRLPLVPRPSAIWSNSRSRTTSASSDWSSPIFSA